MIFRRGNTTLEINIKEDKYTICYTCLSGLKIEVVINIMKQSLISLFCYDRDGRLEDIADFCELALESFVETLEWFGLTEELSIISKEVVLY